MNITFPINKLLDKGITAEDYTIALLIKESKYGLLKSYLKVCGEKFYESLKRLREKGYIEYNTIGDIIPIKEAKITEEFINITLNGDNFEEFYDLYPMKVVRPEGRTDYLRKNKAKAKIKYKKITKNNLFLHDHIIDCLRLDLEWREKSGNMAYMKQMNNWLDNQEWKIIEDRKAKYDEIVETANNKNTTSYGADLI